jgi:hypothetical protein
LIDQRTEQRPAFERREHLPRRTSVAAVDRLQPAARTPRDQPVAEPRVRALLGERRRVETFVRDPLREELP